MDNPDPEDYGRGSQRLYRDLDRKCVAGVCAGFADYFGFDLTLTRVLTVICVFLNAGFLLVYLGLWMALKPKPGTSKEREEPRAQFKESLRRSPTATVSQVRFRYRQMEQGLQRLERYVTSSRFTLDREFRDLER